MGKFGCFFFLIKKDTPNLPKVPIANYLSILKTCNHKRLGIYYLFISIIFSIVGFLFSILIKLELNESYFSIININNHNFYNVTITLHGLIMIFLLVMPILYGGFGNYFIPIFLYSSEVIFPIINNIAFSFLPISFFIALISIFSDFGCGFGWTLYPPLSISLMNFSIAILNILLISLLISGISSFLGSLNFISTSLAFSNGIFFISIFIIGILFTAILLILTLPIFTCGLFFLLSDLNFNTIIYLFNFGGDSILYQHFFWFFGHPEVYILIIPAFIILSHEISTFSQKIIFGFNSMILAIISISFLGSIVWSHHLFSVSLEIDTKSFFSNITIIISLPTGTKIFNWLSTYLNNSLEKYISSSFFSFLFLFSFTLGGATGVILGNATLDLSLHDTYYVVAHFHFVLSLGAIISIIIGILFYLRIIFSFLFSYSFLIKNAFFLLFFSINLSFISMHFLGFNIMPRRILDFPNYFSFWNYLSSIGSISSSLIFLVLSWFLSLFLVFLS